MIQTCTRCGFDFTESASLTCQECGAPRVATTPAAAPAAVAPGVPGAASAEDYVSSEHGRSTAPAESGRKGRRALAAGAGALALAVGAAAVISWAVLGQGGGASTPEEAAEQFFSAVAAQDVVAALDVVLPGEVEGAAEAFEAQRKEAVKKKEMPEQGLTEAVTISVSDWDLAVDEVADQVALVTLEDTDLKVEWDLGKLESEDLQKSVDENVAVELRTGAWPNAEDGGFAEVKAEMAKDGMTPTVVTIEEGGRWYVSFLGTAQNSLFQAVHHSDGDEKFNPSVLDWKTVGEGHEPVTGKNSEEVVEQVLTAFTKADVETGLAMLPQAQVRALWASWDVVEKSVAEGLAEDPSFLGLELELLKWDATETDLDDDRVEVRVKSATFRGAYQDKDFDAADEYDYDDSFDTTLTFADGCFTASDTTQELDDKVCLGDAEFARGGAFPDDEIVLVMRKVDGGLQFDPLATIVHYQSNIDATKMYESWFGFTGVHTMEAVEDKAWASEPGGVHMDEGDAAPIPVPALPEELLSSQG